jgi:hypothetical protein
MTRSSQPHQSGAAARSADIRVSTGGASAAGTSQPPVVGSKKSKTTSASAAGVVGVGPGVVPIEGLETAIREAITPTFSLRNLPAGNRLDERGGATEETLVEGMSRPAEHPQQADSQGTTS